MGNHIQIPSGFCHIDKNCPSPLFPQRAFFIFPKKERSQDESQIYLPKLQETKTGVSLQVRRIPSMERKAGTRNPLAQTEPRRFAPAGMLHQTNPIYLIRKEDPLEAKNKTILRIRPDCLPVRRCHPPCRSRVGCPGNLLFRFPGRSLAHQRSVSIPSTGKQEGTDYVIYEIGGVHASVAITVQNDILPHGDDTRNTIFWSQLLSN